jgi:exopolysaccharide biosynthesis protein
MIKKIMIIGIVFMMTTFISHIDVHAEIDIISESTEEIMGATYKEVKQINNAGILQQYFYLGADFTAGNYRVITGDNYEPDRFYPGTTVTHARNSQELYDEYIIIGGINGDFFESYGVPQEAYIEDGDVISSGIGYHGRLVLGFKQNGDVVVGKPIFDGYEMVVKDQNGKERMTLPVKHINVAYEDDPYDVYAYFDNYNTQLPGGPSKYDTQLVEYKGAVPKIFGRGVVEIVDRTAAHTVQDFHMTIVTENPYVKALVEQGDIISVQRRIVGDFDDVKWAVGLYGTLVKDGNVADPISGIYPDDRHPRSSVGIKADGSIFFVALDGRQPGYSSGATLTEMAELMISYGAVEAYAFDAGGSTTLVTRNDQDDFDVRNSPSDGVPRLVTNSVFLAIQVDFSNDEPHSLPDYSTKLNSPSSISVSSSTLLWDSVENKRAYEVQVNGQTIETILPSLDLKQYINTPGTYEITIKALGDGIYYSDSDPSEVYHYTFVAPEELSPPDDFVISQGILYFDQLDPHDLYEISINDKTYTIKLNRFNLNTLSLGPGSHQITIKKIGDDFETLDSEYVTFIYRIYTAEEEEIKEILGLVKDILLLS